MAETKKELPPDDESTTESKSDNISKSSKSINDRSKASMVSTTTENTASESKMSKSQASTVSKVSEKKNEKETKKPLDAFSDINMGISDGEEEPDNMAKDRRPKHKNKVLL